jgi:thioesterase domain-containing protein
VSDVATDYIDAIRPLARGRYRIAGYSFGGTIAYEIAQQLRNAGEEVEFLGLFDTCNPAVAPRPYSVAERLAQNWKSNEGGIADKIGALGGRVATGLAERKRRNAATAEARALLGQEIAAEDEELRRIQINEISDGLMDTYEPSPYPGALTLFRAKTADDKHAYTELLGWEDLAEGGVETIDVPGEHLTLFDEKNGEAMATAISEGLHTKTTP